MVACVKASGQHRNQRVTLNRMGFLILMLLTGSKLNAFIAKTMHLIFKILYIAFLLLLLRSVIN